MHKVRVWDLPTRVFHWALVLAIVGLVITGNVGGNWMTWHFRLGYLVMTLLLFRILWGFVGGYWSRFRRFVYTPGQLLGYLKGRGHPEHEVGHSPTGAVSVFALIGILLAQVGSGLISDDEIAFIGPLARFVSTELSLQATWYHKEVGKAILIALVVLHILALLYYRWFKQKSLVPAMVTGDKLLEHPATASQDGWAQRGLAVVCALVSGGVVWWVTQLGA
ncbi:MAG: putative Ni/Fe-hydrogenase 1 B-type cytochrome subunit [Pseudomonadota bacterium]|jgi:cytochrome b